MRFLRLALWLGVCTQPAVSNVAASPWAVGAGGSAIEEPMALVNDGSNGAFVTGAFQGDGAYGSTTLTLTAGSTRNAFVMHTNSDGAIVWAVKVGASEESKGEGITSDGAGGVLVTGHFQGVANFGATTLTSGTRGNAFVMRVSSAGDIQWAKIVGSTTGSIAKSIGYGITSDGSGGAYVSGVFSSSATFGATTLTHQSGYNMGGFVAHISGAGAITWAKYVATSVANIRSIARAPDGKLLIAGGCVTHACTIGTTTLGDGASNVAWVARLTNTGHVLWVASLGGGSTSNSASALAADGAGGATITGFFAGSATFGSTTLQTTGDSDKDVFVAHVTSAGVVDWAMRGGTSGASFDMGGGIVPCSDGGTLVTGKFEGPQATLGSFILTTNHHNAKDIFLMRVTSSGDVAWALSTGHQTGSTPYYTSMGQDLIAVDACSAAIVTGQFQSSVLFGGNTLTTNPASNVDAFVARIEGPPPPPSPPNQSPPPPPPCKDREELLAGNSCQTVWYAGLCDCDSMWYYYCGETCGCCGTTSPDPSPGPSPGPSPAVSPPPPGSTSGTSSPPPPGSTTGTSSPPPPGGSTWGSSPPPPAASDNDPSTAMLDLKGSGATIKWNKCMISLLGEDMLYSTCPIVQPAGRGDRRRLDNEASIDAGERIEELTQKVERLERMLSKVLAERAA